MYTCYYYNAVCTLVIITMQYVHLLFHYYNTVCALVIETAGSNDPVRVIRVRVRITFAFPILGKLPISHYLHHNQVMLHSPLLAPQSGHATFPITCTTIRSCYIPHYLNQNQVMLHFPLLAPQSGHATFPITCTTIRSCYNYPGCASNMTSITFTQTTARVPQDYY